MSLVFKKFTLKTFTNTGISLTPLELNEYIDFEVKRVYFITDFTKETSQHCHKIEKEFFVCERGRVTAMIDAGRGIEEGVLEGPHDAIYVGNYVWHGFKDASPDCVLLALSSTHYIPDRSDYVADYGAYKKLASELR